MATLSHLAAFTHDCDTCRLIAHVKPAFGDAFDLYRHENNDGYEDTIIARTGSDGPDYHAIPESLIDAYSDNVEGLASTMGRAAWLAKRQDLVRAILTL